jgi:D-sedoheptulose 7-phosphate isomerase
LEFNDYRKYYIDIIQKINQNEVDALVNKIITAYNNNKMIYLIGNGGSAANASHFAQDLAKGTRQDIKSTKRIRSMSLTDSVPFISALGNDDGYETIFEQQLSTYAQSGDYLIAISGSGNSSNIIRAVEWANNNHLFTIGITGYDGGKLKEISKLLVHVPFNDMCTVESVHSFIFHYIVLDLQEKLKK